MVYKKGGERKMRYRLGKAGVNVFTRDGIKQMVSS